MKHDLLWVFYRIRHTQSPLYETLHIARFRAMRRRTRLPRWTLWKAIFKTDNRLWWFFFFISLKNTLLSYQQSGMMGIFADGNIIFFHSCWRNRWLYIGRDFIKVMFLLMSNHYSQGSNFYLIKLSDIKVQLWRMVDINQYVRERPNTVLPDPKSLRSLICSMY